MLQYENMNLIFNHFKKFYSLYFFYFFSILLFFLFFYLFFFSDILKNFFLWLEWFIQNNIKYVFLFAFLAAFVEGTIFLSILPGTSFTVLLGVFVARGDIENVSLLFLIIVIGAILGDLLGYTLGRLYTTHYLKKKKKYHNSYSQSGEAFIKKHGGKSIFFSRFFRGAKELVIFAAGVLQMNLKKFLFWDFLGAIGWATLWLGIGYVSGFFITDLADIVKTIGLIFLTFFLFSIYIFHKKYKNQLIK